MLCIPIICDLCNHFMTCDRPLRTLHRNKNIRVQLLIVRNHKAKALAFIIGSDHLLNPVHQNPGNLGFFTLTSLILKKLHLNRIEMKRTAGILLRYKKVFLLSFHLYESKAAAVTDKGSHLLLCLPVSLDILATLRHLKTAIIQKFLENRL